MEAGGAEVAGVAGEEEAVGGHGQVLDAGDGGETFDEAGETGTEQGFAPGEAEFTNAEAGEDAAGTFDFLEGEQLGARNPGAEDWGGGCVRCGGGGVRAGGVVEAVAVKVGGLLGLRQAIETTEVATVGDADPEVAQHTAVGIDERGGRRHVTHVTGVGLEAG